MLTVDFGLFLVIALAFMVHTEGVSFLVQPCLQDSNSVRYRVRGCDKVKVIQSINNGVFVPNRVFITIPVFLVIIGKSFKVRCFPWRDKPLMIPKLLYCDTS